jgi:hypothetical protein
MPWLDSRVWCHPKLADLSAPAFRAWINGLCYADGFGTAGKLTNGQVALVRAGKNEIKELIAAGLWEMENGEVLIHDWDEYNGKRDERRAADRERKRRERAAAKEAAESNGQSADSPADNPWDRYADNSRTLG